MEPHGADELIQAVKVPLIPDQVACLNLLGGSGMDQGQPPRPVIHDHLNPFGADNHVPEVVVPELGRFSIDVSTHDALYGKGGSPGPPYFFFA